MRTFRLLRSIVVSGAFICCFEVFSAQLPLHKPLRILIVSDEVNPHGLSDSDLTQPGDLSEALSATGNGLNIDIVTEVPTNDIHLATAYLNAEVSSEERYDVLIYFAHRIPNDASASVNQNDQDGFVAAVESFLETGGGVIGFHHGTYTAAGKQGILNVLGATASGAVPYDQVNGQNVINVAPGHFVTTNEIAYPSTTTYSDIDHGIVQNSYQFFNNTPDERYPTFNINTTAGAIEYLFASDYNSQSHILGFVHTRPEWLGRVVVYVPGEYQPNALDDKEGNNFQILANAILYSAKLEEGLVTSVGRKTEEKIMPVPNPVGNALVIDGANNFDSYEVFSLRGESLKKGNILNGSINVEELKSGTYILKLFGDEVNVVRFVKQ